MLRAARLLTRQRPRKAQSRSQHLLVLLRHGQSEWNASKRFTGWVDVDLTEQGREEATHAGIMLKRHGFEFDEAHTSLLKRAVRTLWSALHCCDQHWIPVRRSWRLTRHYGALTGMSKQEVKDQMGGNCPKIQKRLLQERSACGRRPLLDGAGSALSTFGAQRLAHGESLRMCQERVPYWVDNIAPAMRRGKASVGRTIIH